MFKSQIRLVSFILGVSLTAVMFVMYQGGIEVPMRSMYCTVLPLCIFLGAHWIPGKDLLFDE